MTNKTETFDVKLSCEGQAKLCKEKGYPHFAPLDGRCYNCKMNIYKLDTSMKWPSGISVERATSTLVTGCPHCHYSYCE